MAYIGTISRALLESATAYYVGGVPITVLDALGNIVIGATPPDAPEIISTIADRVYVVGSGPYTIDLSEKFSGAAQFVVSPTNANLSLSGNILTITPTAILAQTAISVIGRNGGGDSDALTFALTINAPAPALLQPLPDQSLSFGAPNVTIPLDDYFSGVASYVVSPAANGATLSGRNLVLSAAQTRGLEITVTGTNATGQSASDTFLFAVQQTTQAPTVLTPPAITGSSTVGSPLTRAAGTATAIPASTRATVWLRNGTAIPGETGNTLYTSTFAPGDVITTDDVWTNILGTATGSSAPFTLTEQPTLQILDITTPLVAGQPASVTFNSAPETVTGNVTFAGSGATRTFTAPSGTLTIGATLAGHTPFSQTYPVQPAPAALAVTADNTAQIVNADETSPDLSLAIVAPTPAEYRGTITLDPADAANGPVVELAPAITGTGAVDQTLTLQHLGIFGTLGADVTLDGGWPDGSVGRTYVVRAQDAGTTVRYAGVAVDSRGTRPFQSNGIAIAAAVSATPDTFAVAAANIDGTTTESGETWTRTMTSGQVEAIGGRLVTRSNAAYVRGALNRGGNQYVECDLIVGTSVQGVYPAVRVQTDPTNPALRRGLAAAPQNLAGIRMRHYNAGGGVAEMTSDWVFPTDGSWAAGTTHRIGLGITEAGAATLYADGVPVKTATFTDLSNGGAGVISNGTAGTNGMAVDNVIIRATR